MFRYLGFIYSNTFARLMTGYSILPTTILILVASTVNLMYSLNFTDLFIQKIPMGDVFYGGLLPVVYYQGYIIHKFRYCDWSVWAFIINALYSTTQCLKFTFGINIPTPVLQLLAILYLILAIFVVVDLVKVDFKYCNK